VAFDELTRLANALLNRIEPILKNQRKAEQAAQKLREQEQLARKRQAILSNSGSIKSEDIQHRRNHRQAPELMMIEDDAFSRRLVENEDGVDALMKCGENMYDIIFMDCQMPRMDGYITTHEIRSQEASGLKHMPVVAMTANAMVGDREKCLNAGMDDYLSKPLRAEHLRKILQHWFILDDAKAGITVEKPKAETTLTADESPVDLDQLRMFTDGDPEEEKALAELFLEQAQEMIMLLEQNMGADKNDVWKSAAHRFKGSSGNLGAMPLHQLCKRAEMHFEDEESKKNDMLAAIKAATKNVELFFHAAA
jgi:CheY-like chemotaxis protein/HPt (histidine-containing phosphotransfer) domain-containing protein